VIGGAIQQTKTGLSGGRQKQKGTGSAASQKGFLGRHN
jgi:hypothetical protein